MNTNEIISKKGKAKKKEIKVIDYEQTLENPIILNSILKRKLNSNNIMKSLNSEISNKIKANIALDIFNNNANILSSILSKKNFNGGSYAKTPISRPKTEKTTKTIEIYGNHHHYLGRLLKGINNSGNDINDINNTNIENHYIGQLNANTIDNNRKNKIEYNNCKIYFSPYLQKSGKKEKILYNKNNGYDNKIYETEFNIINNKVKKTKNVNGYEERNQKKILKNTNIKEINEIKEEKEGQNSKSKSNIKIYIKKAIKSNLNDNISKKEKEKIDQSPNISFIPIGKGKKDVENDKEISYEEKEKEKYLFLLNNYRKRVIKQFMLYFKPYCYSFVKKYYNIFISNLKNINNDNKSKQKGYSKKIKKRNVYDNGKGIKDLKLAQLNYNKHNFTNYTSNNDTENSDIYFNSFNIKKNQIEKDNSNPIKKINHFLINSNNINFSTKENLKNKNLSKNQNNELYRNNIELLKKYSQIIQRKRRKKIISNNYINEDNSNYYLKNENKTIDISLNNNKYYSLRNSYKRRDKIDYSPHINSISNGEITKEESIKLDENYISKIRPMLSRQKVKGNKMKDEIKLKSPINSRPLSQKRNGENKFYKNKNIIIHKKNNKIIIISRKEKINNINNSHYNKNYVSKTIKNIFTRDRKINIHINYVFFVPAKNKDKKKYKKNNKFMKISKNFSFTYIGNFNRNQNKAKIYSKKKLSSIKEEEEKSKCSISMSMLLQNTKTIDEYNSIINYLIEKIHNYYILRMKTIFLYNLKVINLSYQLNTILKNIIFKRIKFINKDNKNNKNGNKPEYNNIKNNSNAKFLLDDKITINIK